MALIRRDSIPNIIFLLGIFAYIAEVFTISNFAFVPDAHQDSHIENIYSGLSPVEKDTMQVNERRAIHSYITPEDTAIKSLASHSDSIEDIYSISFNWIYVSEQRLHNIPERWLFPNEFLVDTPRYPDSPVPGIPASDCEEQANSMVSLFRAWGVPAADIRVVLGSINQVDPRKGHAWVEIFIDGQWLPLDPNNGPYWDDARERLIERKTIPFDYYINHEYPVVAVHFYYNDIYYLDLEDDSGNAPVSWR